MGEHHSESVLVVPTQVFWQVGQFQGFAADPDPYMRVLLQPENLSFRPRDTVEDDARFKQLIPYIVFRSIADMGREIVFRYTRGKQQGEARLRAKKSIGIGGHISESDVHESVGASTFERGMQREIAEEVRIRSPYTSHCVGLINDDSNDVGRVHLGVVYFFDLERPEVTALDPEMDDCGFTTTQELLTNKHEFETWSQICLDSLFLPQKRRAGGGGAVP